jgi:hypothetical protein
LAREQGLALGQHRLRRVTDHVARSSIDEKILLLDAEGEFRLGHRSQPIAHLHLLPARAQTYH